ncbi:MAG: hypothetical protein DI603_14690 [Roseateles depolymerans]|uniref:Prepilin-type N-terminal cleavage/methylation domain-containing protein n=1 Tax=Roseateles depolymerans TaxID=76731 RepID=A0A2W5FHB9_9BURK|nr:MAG: hypothetical protein DI603_14690 [Roseateles depolymerans]
MQLRSRRIAQQGLSLVELMVGITIGLIITAGASMVAVNQINEHRRLTLETQVQQDLRTAADLIQQDLRRAGFRGVPSDGVWSPASGGATPISEQQAAPNPYAEITQTTSEDGNLVVRQYSYAKTNAQGLYTSTPSPGNNERFGVRWDRSAGVLYIQIGMNANGSENWQPITDPDLLRITDFQLTPITQSVALSDFCDPCPTGATCTASSTTLTVRQVNFVIRAQARHDPNVIRTLSGVERVRADAQAGACPTW